MTTDDKAAAELSAATRHFLTNPDAFLSDKRSRRWLFSVLAAINKSKAAEHDAVLRALSKALVLSPHCWTFLTDYLSSCPAPFGSLLSRLDSGTSLNVEKRRLRDESAALLTCLALVRTDSYFRHLWPWSKLYEVCSYKSNSIKDYTFIRVLFFFPRL